MLEGLVEVCGVRFRLCVGSLSDVILFFFFLRAGYSRNVSRHVVGSCCFCPQVRDVKHESSLGSLKVPLTELLEAEEMTINKRFPLKNSGPSCTLKIKMALKVRRILIGSHHYMVDTVVRDDTLNYVGVTCSGF